MGGPTGAGPARFSYQPGCGQDCAILRRPTRDTLYRARNGEPKMPRALNVRLRTGSIRLLDGPWEFARKQLSPRTTGGAPSLCSLVEAKPGDIDWATSLLT